MAATGPQAYLEDNPRSSAIRIRGRYINLARLSEDYHLDHGYLSRIFAGKGNPSSNYLKTIADALHMTIDDLMDAIQERKEEMEEERARRLGLET